MWQIISNGTVQRLQGELQNRVFQTAKTYNVILQFMLTIMFKKKKTFDDSSALMSILNVLLKVCKKYEKCGR